jgi:hypothetical protein
MAKTDQVFEILISTFPELKSHWDQYLMMEYKHEEYKTDPHLYSDIAEIARFIVNKTKASDTQNFELFFEKVELILSDSDPDITNLIVIGLLEGIQNICGTEVDYHVVFNRWLKPITKRAWDDLIHFWESEESKNKWEEMQRKRLS